MKLINADAPQTCKCICAMKVISFWSTLSFPVASLCDERDAESAENLLCRLWIVDERVPVALPTLRAVVELGLPLLRRMSCMPLQQEVGVCLAEVCSVDSSV